MITLKIPFVRSIASEISTWQLPPFFVIHDQLNSQLIDLCTFSPAKTTLSGTKMPPKPKTPVTQSLPPHLSPGDFVEISPDEPGFRGSWFTATIVKPVASTSRTKFLVQYDKLFADEAGKKPLREEVDTVHIRPPAPRERARKFVFGEEVDAWVNDGWWEGVITEDLGNGRFSVYFSPTREQIEFEDKDMRLHREWENGVWKPPLEQQEEEKTLKKRVEDYEEPVMVEEIMSYKSMTGVKTKSSKQANNEKLMSHRRKSTEKLVPNGDMTERKYSNGTMVEVKSDEDGFQGAWFAATIVKKNGKDKYIVQYESLRTDGDTDFLKEEIDTMHIRPRPPELITVDGFSNLDEVDAYYNDGWWVGVVSKVLRDSRYKVYFRSTDEEMVFDHSELRLHEEWIDGKWVAASQGRGFDC